MSNGPAARPVNAPIMRLLTQLNGVIHFECNARFSDGNFDRVIDATYSFTGVGSDM